MTRLAAASSLAAIAVFLAAFLPFTLASVVGVTSGGGVAAAVRAGVEVLETAADADRALAATEAAGELWGAARRPCAGQDQGSSSAGSCCRPTQSR